MTFTVDVTLVVVPSAKVTVDVRVYEPTRVIVNVANMEPLASVVPVKEVGPWTAPSIVAMCVDTGAPTRTGVVFVVTHTVETAPELYTYDPLMLTVGFDVGLGVAVGVGLGVGVGADVGAGVTEGAGSALCDGSAD